MTAPKKAAAKQAAPKKTAATERLSRRRIPASAALALTLLAGSALTSPPAGADPVNYPACPVKEDPDCFLLNRVNENVFSIPPGQEGRVIAQAHAACEFMSADHSGTNPMLDYGVWFTRQPGGEAVSPPISTDGAARFALYAAKAYCPALLP